MSCNLRKRERLPRIISTLSVLVTNVKHRLALQPVTLSTAINALRMTRALITCYLLLANFQLLVLAPYLSPDHHNLRGKINYACDGDGYGIKCSVLLTWLSTWWQCTVMKKWTRLELVLTKEQQFRKEIDAGMLLALWHARHKIMVGCMRQLFMHCMVHCRKRNKHNIPGSEEGLQAETSTICTITSTCRYTSWKRTVGDRLTHIWRHNLFSIYRKDTLCPKA